MRSLRQCPVFCSQHCAGYKGKGASVWSRYTIIHTAQDKTIFQHWSWNRPSWEDAVAQDFLKSIWTWANSSLAQNIHVCVARLLPNIIQGMLAQSNPKSSFWNLHSTKKKWISIGVDILLSHHETVTRYRVSVETLLTSAVACNLWVWAGIGDIPRMKQSVHRRWPYGIVCQLETLFLTIFAASAFKDKCFTLTLFVIFPPDMTSAFADLMGFAYGQLPSPWLFCDDYHHPEWQPLC